MKNTKNITNNKGLTLVELLVSLSIVSMVIVVTIAFSLMGLKAYNRGINQSDVQYDVRRTSAKLTEELRNATDFSLNTNAIGTTAPPIIIKDELEFLDIDEGDEYKCEISADKNILKVYLWAEKKGITNISTSYEMTTDILLNNISIQPPITTTSTIQIFYSSPNDDDFKAVWE